MSTSGFDAGRFGRLLALIASVSAVFVITSAEALEGRIFQLSVFAIGVVAIGTAMVGFLIAAGAAYDKPRADADDSTRETGDTGESVQETDDSSGIVGPYES